MNRNYRALGLANDPNPGFGRVNPQVRPAAELEEEEGEKLADLAVTDEEAMRICTGRSLAKGHRLPKRLTAKQLVRRPLRCSVAHRHSPVLRCQTVVGALVEAHGDDIVAMCRDMKRNAMQHTAGTLRVLLDAYRQQGDANAQRFRAPVKRL